MVPEVGRLGLGTEWPVAMLAWMPRPQLLTACHLTPHGHLQSEQKGGGGGR